MRLPKKYQGITPGEWGAAEPGGRQPHWTVWAKETIGRKWTTWICRMYCGEAPMEEQPNAVLISDSPRLAHAVLRLRELLLEQRGLMPKHCGHDFDCVCLGDKIKADLESTKEWSA